MQRREAALASEGVEGIFSEVVFLHFFAFPSFVRVTLQHRFMRPGLGLGGAAQ